MRIKGPFPPSVPKIDQSSSAPALPAIQYTVLKTAAQLDKQVIKSAMPVVALSASEEGKTQEEYGLEAISLIAQMTAVLRSDQMDRWKSLKAQLDSIRPYCDPTIQQFIDHSTQTPNLAEMQVWLKNNKEEILASLRNEQRGPTNCMNFFWYLAEGMHSSTPNAFFTEWIDSDGGGGSNLIEIMPKFVVSYYYQQYMPQDPAGLKNQLTIFYNCLPQNFPSPIFASARTQLGNDISAISRGEALPWLDEGGLSLSDYINNGKVVFAEYINRK